MLVLAWYIALVLEDTLARDNVLEKIVGAECEQQSELKLPKRHHLLGSCHQMSYLFVV